MATPRKTFPQSIRLRDTLGRVSLAVDAPSKLRTFSMLAYTGDVVDLCVDDEKVRMIFDLGGIAPVADGERVLILRDHECDEILGQSTSVKITDAGVNIAGVLTGAGEDVDPVCEMADKGFVWQASLGLDFDEGAVMFLPEGASTTINARAVEGPLYIATTSTIKESSFTGLGLDRNTSSVVMSDKPQNGQTVAVKIKESPMSEQKPNPAPTPEQLAAATQAGADGAIARMSALGAAFPNAGEFVIEQFKKGHDVDKAKAEYVPVLEAKLSALTTAKDTEITTLKAEVKTLADKLAAVPPDGHGAPIRTVTMSAAGAKATTGKASEAQAKLSALIDEKIKLKGMTRQAATIAVYAENEPLRQQWVDEINATKA